MSILKLKDSQGNWISVPTLKGDKGNGIQSAVLNNDYTLTLTFTDGTTYTTPSIRGEKGEQGEPATDMDIHICSASEYDSETRIPTIANPNDKTFYLVPTEDGTSPDLFTEWVYVNNAWEMFGSMKIDLSGYLTDVTVDGTSVVTDGVAEIPVANNFDFGLVKIGTGIGMSNGKLNLLLPAATDIKSGLGTTNALFPLTQHYSTFYGLAKAAGADEKDSTLAFGTYSDNAKSSIQNMLGITDKYSPKEWVAESETELVTNAHNIGDLFYIGETLYKVIADLNAGDAVNVGVNVEEVNVNDILDDYATKEDVQDNVSIVEKSASGAVASFNDGMDDMPLKSLMVDINPVQDLHGYDSPWVGGGGKNLFDKTLMRDREAWYNIAVKVKPSTKYTMSTDRASAISTGLYLYLNSTNTQGGGNSSAVYAGSPVTVTSTEDGYVYVSQRRASGEDSFQNYHYQIEEGETATSYAPYENICPISGWTGAKVVRTGKNILGGLELYNAMKATFTNSTFDDANHTVMSTPSQASSKKIIDIRFKANTAYTIIVQFSNNAVTSAGNGCPNIAFRYTDGSNTSLSVPSYTVNQVIVAAFVSNPAKTLDMITGSWNTGTATIYCDNTGIFEGDVSVGDYSAYVGTTIPISWADEAGTVYGGKLDVLSGVMRVEWLSADGGDLTWSKINDYNYGNFYTLPTPLAFYVSTRPTVISSSYKSESNQSAPSTGDSYVWIRSMSASNRRIYVKDTSKASMTAEEFQTAMTGVQFVYELATPIEIQLTPHEVNSLLGTNNIFADTGDTSIEYFSQVDKDLIDYIETSLKPYAKEERLNDYVSDVQIDGSSIVTDGVASIPMADDTHLGAVMVNGAYGIGRFGTNGALYINYPTSAYIKSGTNNYRPIVSALQHESVFYGLAKIAGHDEKDSTLEVGTYTDEAKTAIKQMLGVHDTIDSFVEEVTGTDVTIIGQPSYRYNCGELYSLTVTPPSSGTIDIRFTSGSSPTVLTLPSTVKMPEWWVEVEANTIYEMCITDGIYCGVMTWAI